MVVAQLTLFTVVLTAHFETSTRWPRPPRNPILRYKIHNPIDVYVHSAHVKSFIPEMAMPGDIKMSHDNPEQSRDMQRADHSEFHETAQQKDMEPTKWNIGGSAHVHKDTQHATVRMKLSKLATSRTTIGRASPPQRCCLPTQVEATVISHRRLFGGQDTPEDSVRFIK